jgi:CDP-diacylglycerol--glycerol-3-phosphate 3-phosphatidyltransferase
MTATPTPSPEPLLHVPNLLSFARIPLAVVLFVCIVKQWWFAGLIVFLIATATDWLDGWWARKYGPLTLVGRNLDPLADKILVCGAFIYLIPVEPAGILPWMVTVVVCRELLVTGIRGMVEAAGKKFGADWFGKLKMGLQCAVLIGVFLIRWLVSLERDWHESLPSAAATVSDVLAVLEPVQLVLLWAMLAATVGSGVQYVVKAAKLLR